MKGADFGGELLDLDSIWEFDWHIVFSAISGSGMAFTSAIADRCSMVSPINTNRPRFSLGQVVATPGALAAMEASGQGPAEFLSRHIRGDWGTVDAEDWALNDRAVVEGTRILSAYVTARNERLWVITEADRSSTCLLLPEEY